MHVKSITINNILSIEDQELTFDGSGLVLLDGWNYDDNTANGAGKTSIWNALSFGLYGKLPRKITSSEILRRGTKRGYVKVEVHSNGHDIAVERHRPKKEIFTVDGKTLSSQEELEKYLGLSYKQFLVCMYSAQSSSTRFISLNDTEKKDFFLDVVELNKFDDVRKAINDKLDDLVKDLNTAVSNIEKTDFKISTLSESVGDEADIIDQISLLDISELEQKLSEIDLTEPDVSKFKDLKKKISIKLDDVKEQLLCISGFRQTVKDIDSQLKDLEQHDATGDVECPHCQNSFVLQGDNSFTVDELNEKISAKMEKLNGRRSKLVARINTESDLISQRDELTDLINKADEKYRLHSAGYLKNRERYAEIKSKIEIRKSKINMLSSALDKIKSTKTQIIELKKYKKEQESVLGGIAKEVETHKALLSVFAPTGAPAYVLDSVIDLFNERVADYVAMIWPNASYELLSYKENKNKTIKAKLSDSLIINGKNVSIGSLSGGELRCLCLSIDFALVEMVEAIGSINISPYVLDEPFEGLDAANRERAVDMLDRLSQSRQVWVIDHQSEAKAMFSDIVKIEKRNGISKCLAN